MRMPRAALIAFALAAFATPGTLSAQRGAPAPAGRGAAAPQGQAQIRVTQVRPNIYMLTGAGSNITVMPFDLGAVVVDTGTTAHGRRS